MTANTIDRSAGAYIGGIKLFSDGSVSGRTALVSEPFWEVMKRHSDDFERGVASGCCGSKRIWYSISGSCNGDRAIDLIVDTFYEEKAWLTDAPSVRIEHATMPSKSALQKALNGDRLCATTHLLIL